MFFFPLRIIITNFLKLQNLASPRISSFVLFSRFNGIPIMVNLFLEWFLNAVIYHFNNFHLISGPHHNFCLVIHLSHCYLVNFLITWLCPFSDKTKNSRDKFYSIYLGHEVVIPERRKTKEMSSTTSPDDSLEIVSRHRAGRESKKNSINFQ